MTKKILLTLFVKLSYSYVIFLSYLLVVFDSSKVFEI